ncbi:MAG: twin-arginine translocation signal domain-containing protein, partial [Gammaproteobacteria bacterium]|nr:twin-arginine translocation signal domain-containing protein [Gammaproteobacteria bacterium]
MNIEQIVDKTYYWVDEKARAGSLSLARKLSRRNFLSRLGMILAGAAAFPLLPVARSFAQNSITEVGDPQSCE